MNGNAREHPTTQQPTPEGAAHAKGPSEPLPIRWWLCELELLGFTDEQVDRLLVTKLRYLRGSILG